MNYVDPFSRIDAQDQKKVQIKGASTKQPKISVDSDDDMIMINQSRARAEHNSQDPSSNAD